MKTNPPDPNITEYDGIRIGDMITAYHKGYHKVIGFHNLGYDYSMQINYERVADSNGNPVKGKNSCSYKYCKKIDAQTLKADFDYELYELQRKYRVLDAILTQLEAEQNATTTN